MSDLEEFHHQLIADIQGDADVLGLVTVEAFFEKVGDLLTEAGELDGANRAYFEGGGASNPMRIDGYGGDPRDGDGVLSIVLCDFELSDEVRVQNKDQIQRLLQRLYRFVVSSLKTDFREQLEETSAGFGVADLIATTWKDVEKVKLIIVTNADFRARADAANVKDLDGRPVTLSVWDLKRLKQYMEQGQARANLIIDFDRDFGGGVPLLAASGSDSALESYLAVIPGKQLAAIYDKWGPRLLEANVRSFLQARGKVNQGIRNTIRDEPHMFFSYNNGLSATADAIEVEQTDLGLRLVRADNLQIVNGGHARETDPQEAAARLGCPGTDASDRRLTPFPDPDRVVPAVANKFPVWREKFPVPLSREKVRKPLTQIRDFSRKRASAPPAARNSLLIRCYQGTRPQTAPTKLGD